jgi:hypothetical protein
VESIPSPAAQLIITIIPIVGIVMGAVVIIVFLRWNHQQRMALIDQGIAPPRMLDLRAFSLLAGLLSGAVGLALTVVQLILAQGDAGYGLLGGVIPLAVGIGFLGYYGVTGRSSGS